jgi:hypothetical protein
MGINTEEDLDESPISSMVSKYQVTRTISVMSFAVVPCTFSKIARTLSLSPSTSYLDSVSPSALLM